MSPRCFTAFLGILLFCSPLFATDRFFADLSAKSADGHWRVEAKSPDNRSGDPWSKPFQENFAYVLRHDGRLLWSRKQGSGWPAGYHEPSPIKLSVSNSGRVVITTGWNTLMVVGSDGGPLVEIDPAHGRFGGVSPENELFPEKERNTNVSRTTAGHFWRSGSIDFFHEDAEGPVYVLRTYWGRWIVLDLKTGKAVTPTPARLAGIELSAKRHVRDLLAAYSASKLPKDDEGCPDWDWVSAVHQAGCLGMRDAIPAVRRMESDSRITSLGNYGEMAPRLIARMALRRLGEVPTTPPGFLFGDSRNVPSTRYGPSRIKERWGAVSGIKVGMTKKDLLARVGAPDETDVFQKTWEYDMEGDTTLLVAWSKGVGDPVVSWINIVPATWKIGGTRERRLFR